MCAAKNWHGRLADPSWPPPACKASCDEEARPGFSSCSADEFEDAEEVFTAKAALLADLIRRSRCCVMYTGAGISTSAGLKDYATKAKGGAGEKVVSNTTASHFDAKPSKAHRILAAMYHAGFVKHWLQQNHDGLPQKASMPQNDINELHGAWFDPSNPVVHFGARIRPDLFDWMLQMEFCCDLCIAVGTSLCDTPSTADRFIVSSASRAAEEIPRSLGAAVVGLQRTRLDAFAQLKVYGLIDDFFCSVAQALDLSWQDSLSIIADPEGCASDCTVEGPEPLQADGQNPLSSESSGTPEAKAEKPASSESNKAPEAESHKLTPTANSEAPDGVNEKPPPAERIEAPDIENEKLSELAKLLRPDAKVFITGGPLEGYTTKVKGRTSEGHIDLEGGVVLGRWWLDTNVALPIPISLDPVGVPNGFKSVLEGAQLALSAARRGPPPAFLEGAWEGEAILLGEERAHHPTEPASRTQPFRWVLGLGDKNSILGAGYTTWPAAQVTSERRGRVWCTFRGQYNQEPDGELQLNGDWEAVPGSRVRSLGLGPQQGDPVRSRFRFMGRVYWNHNACKLQCAGIWQDDNNTPVSGAFSMIRRSHAGVKAGIWSGFVSGQAQQWVLCVQPKLQALGIWGAAERSQEHEAVWNGLTLLRGMLVDEEVKLEEDDLPDAEIGRLVCTGTLDSDGLLVGDCAEIDTQGAQCRKGTYCLQHQSRYKPMTFADIPGEYEHSKGGVVRVSIQGQCQGRHLLVDNPYVQEVQRVPVEEVCLPDGSITLNSQLGWLGPGQIEWSNGSIWKKMIELEGACAAPAGKS